MGNCFISPSSSIVFLPQSQEKAFFACCRYFNSYTFVIVQCTTPSAPLNGMRSPDTAAIAVAAMLTFSCDSGYALSGDATSTCIDSGDGTGAAFNIDMAATKCGKFYVTLLK